MAASYGLFLQLFSLRTVVEVLVGVNAKARARVRDITLRMTSLKLRLEAAAYFLMRLNVQHVVFSFMS